MKAIAMLFLISFSSLALDCQTNPKVREDGFNFSTWMEALSNEYDAFLLSNDPKKVTPEWLKGEISYVDEKQFSRLFEIAFHENLIKNWTSMYYVYHFMEGESNISISTFVFFKGNRCWGTSFLHNNNKRYYINEKNAHRIIGVKPLMHWSGGLAFVSKFGRNWENKKNVFLIGSLDATEFKPILELYDKSIFD
ncbi:MAG: hypothetical protein H6574_14235 [Lewinellaceae bacterium]|nr:hypothetical protein [Saprospiraceae bacterium]MCB9317491.1 hypothetical protein [Lewinellaceae bacterium]MCB9332239.1 hypothetical protein [Lewinellaceae bacterium]